MNVVRLMVVGNSMEAETICGLLRTEGIACDHRQTDMGAGAGDAVGDSGPREILVARDDLETRAAACHHRRLVGRAVLLANGSFSASPTGAWSLASPSRKAALYGGGSHAHAAKEAHARPAVRVQLGRAVYIEAVPIRSRGLFGRPSPGTCPPTAPLRRSWRRRRHAPRLPGSLPSRRRFRRRPRP